MPKHPRRRRLIPALAILLSTLAFVSASDGQVMPASATNPAPPISSTDIRYLQTGDTYRVAVERQGVKKEFEGVLLKANEKWIVLKAAGPPVERGVPIAAKVPYVNRLFRNVGVGRLEEIRWLPREAVTIHGRSKAGKVATSELALPEVPPSDAGYFIELVHDGKEVAHTAKVTFGDKHLTCHQKICEARERGVPVLSEIPIVGRAFRKEYMRVDVVDVQYSWDDVLCITPRELPPDPQK